MRERWDGERRGQSRDRKEGVEELLQQGLRGSRDKAQRCCEESSERLEKRVFLLRSL